MSSVALAGNVLSAAASCAQRRPTAWRGGASHRCCCCLCLAGGRRDLLGFTRFRFGYGKFRFVGFENYAHLLNDRTFRRSL